MFICGAVAVRFELFPYGYLKNAFDAADALLVREKGDKVPFALGAKPLHPEDWASPAVRQPDLSGVERYKPDQSFFGYTVYTPVAPGFPVRLIDMAGNTVHEWHLPTAELAGPRDDGMGLAPGEKITIAYPRVMPNGDLLLVLGVPPFYTPWGMGIVKLDKDSRLIWKYLKQAHHDLDVAPDGRIYALLHTVIRKPWPGLERIQTPFIDDQVVVLDDKGNELSVVSVLEAIQGSKYESILQFADPNRPKGDLLHVNSVTYLNQQAAAIFPGAEEGDVLLSLRQIGVIAVMNIKKRSIVWALKGPWHMQHDPDILSNGNLLIFDNRGDVKNDGGSRVIEFNPQTMEIVWQYPDDTGERLYTSIYGSQQRLPNGNTLISESNNGRILEVTKAGEVVWEYHVPEQRTSGRGNEVATVVFSHRFAPGELEFLN